MTWEEAIKDLREAVEFLDKVRGATITDQIAAGTDHWDWLERAARRIAEMDKTAEVDAESREAQ